MLLLRCAATGQEPHVLHGSLHAAYALCCPVSGLCCVGGNAQAQYCCVIWRQVGAALVALRLGRVWSTHEVYSKCVMVMQRFNLCWQLLQLMVSKTLWS